MTSKISDRNNRLERKKELTRQIKALTEERAALCISDKARQQEVVPVYMRLLSPKMILMRVLPGCMPTTPALNAGITIIMHHYGLKKSDCGYIEIESEIDQEGDAFAGVINPKTNDRWRATWELWDWGEDGPLLFSESLNQQKISTQ